MQIPAASWEASLIQEPSYTSPFILILPQDTAWHLPMHKPKWASRFLAYTLWDTQGVSPGKGPQDEHT
jgi:hypothetical protein